MGLAPLAPTPGASAQRGNLEQQVWGELVAVATHFKAHIIVVYVCGHAGVGGNELADQYAGIASKTCAQDRAAIGLGTARTVARRQAALRWDDASKRIPPSEVGSLPADHIWRRVTARGPVQHAHGLGRAVECRLA